MVKHPEIGMGLETSHKWPRVHKGITIEYASVDNFLKIGIPVLYHYEKKKT